MSDRKERRSGSSTSAAGRPSASSLTDAVVAALAEVEKSPPDGHAKEKNDEASKKGQRKVDRNDATLKMGSVDPAADAKPSAEQDKTLPDSPRADAPAADSPPADQDKTLQDPPDKAPAAEAAPSAPAPSEPAPIAAPREEAPKEEPSTSDQSIPPAAAPTAPKETPKGIAVDYFGRTDVGLVREHNEDNFLVVDLQAQKRGIGPVILHTAIEGAGTLFAVCDGMGGAAAGEVASQMAVDTIHEMMQNGGAPRDRDHFARRLVRSIEEAGSRIFAAAKMDRTRRGMGTTSTVAGLIDNTLFVGQVGDSRAYVLRGDSFAQITKDQSLVNQLIEAGQLTEEEAEAFEHSNIILQALGTTEEVTVDLTFLELRRGDRLMMCSDGLSGLVHGDMIKEVMKSSRDLVECANQLIAMANAGGGHDNITVVLADFDGENLKARAPEDRVAYMQYPLPPEDPKNPDPAPRSTNIKSGGPKPGSDVKRDGASALSGQSEGGGRGMLVGVMIVVVVLVVLAYLLYSSGSPPPTTTTRTTVSHGAPASTTTTNIHVLTDIDDATLYVDGVSRGALSDGMHVTVTPGPHTVQARREGHVLASATVTTTAGSGSMLSLVADHLAPASLVPPPTAPPPTAAAPPSTASTEEPAPAPTHVHAATHAPPASEAPAPAPSEAMPSGVDIPPSSTAP
jgi:serine/threonine protein phosphatase PrpC